MPVTFPDSIVMTDPSVILNALAHEDPYTETEERIPDPEGYYVGQEQYGYDDDDFDKKPDYDDAYEPDVFSYDCEY